MKKGLFELCIILLTISTTSDLYAQKKGLCCGPTTVFGTSFYCGTYVTKDWCGGSGSDGFTWKGQVDTCPSKANATAACDAKDQRISLKIEFEEQNKSIELSWSINENLLQKGGFYVQRSRDNVHFKSIAFIEGGESSTIGKLYQYTDHYPFLEAYYQLTWYSDRTYKSQTVFAVAAKKGRLLLFPASNSGQVRIVLSTVHDTKSEISFYDMSGRQVLKQTINPGSPNSINTSTLGKGMFLVRMIQNTEVYSTKFIKN